MNGDKLPHPNDRSVWWSWQVADLRLLLCDVECATTKAARSRVGAECGGGILSRHVCLGSTQRVT